MKNKILLFVLSILPICIFAQATQAPIIVQNASSASSFATLAAAYAAATDGDNMYLPGGIFLLQPTGTFSWNKRLNVFGSGYRPDSAVATGSSTINSAINFGAGASGSYFSAVFISNTLSTTAAINNLTFSRCRLTDVDWRPSNTTSNLIFNHCVFYSNMQYANGNITMSNCIVSIKPTASIGNPDGSIGTPNLQFNNCVVMYECINCVFNPLFATEATNVAVSASIVFLSGNVRARSGTSYLFTNNLFIGSSNFINFDPSINIGNTVQDFSFQPSVFVNQSSVTYNLLHDYHTQAACNCSDKGIYSGTTPFKDVSEVPYIVERQVTARPTTNQLPFRFRVKTNN